MRTFDLVVIGSGPAGEKGAAQAAYFGKSVAIVEMAPNVGGAGINTGTVPSKTLRETALYFSGLKQRGLYGIDYSLRNNLTIRDFMHREREVVRSLRSLVESNIEKHRVTFISGRAAFVDNHIIEITGPEGAQEIRGEIILVATGSRPRPTPIDDERVFDSDSVLHMKSLPRTMAILGAGVIGCEYATMFAALGIKVSLIDARDRLLSFLDLEISERLRQQMMLLGTDVRLSTRVEGIEPGSELTLTLSDGKTLSVETALFAGGRRGNTDTLALERAGLEPDANGTIKVDEDFRTAVPNIYAAGDVVGFPALASISMEQARVAMCRAFDLKYKTKVAPVYPLAVYTIPEVAMVGATEEQCREKNVDFLSGKAHYDSNSRGQIIGDLQGEIKLIFERGSRRLLGVHIIGEMASELIHIGLLAMETNATIDLFIDTVFNHPTLGEVYKYAAYDGMGKS